MNSLRNGEYFGETNQIINFEGLTITDTEYTHPYVDWHYHENVYFTFLLQGSMTEGNKREIYGCSAGTLLYHHWEDPHYNIKSDVFTRGFHIEITQNWFERFDIQKNKVEGSFNIKIRPSNYWYIRFLKKRKPMTVLSKWLSISYYYIFSVN